MNQIPMFIQVLLYSITGIITLILVALFWWQLQVLKGKSFKNPDGSVDDWHVEKLCYGIAFADVFIQCPVGIISSVLLFLGFKIGVYLFALVAFFNIWANVMTTATSLRFYKPKKNFVWFMLYPFGSLLGLLYIILTLIYFNELFGI